MAPPVASPARRLLAERQEAAPPFTGHDRVAAMFPVVAAYAPDPARTLARAKRIVAGEVGAMDAVLRTEAVVNEWLIEMSSGLMQYVYATVRAAHEPPPPGADDRRASLATRVAAEMRSFWNEVFKEGKKSSTSPRPLGEAEIRSAEDITTSAEIFLLARSLAEVQLAVQPLPEAPGLTVGVTLDVFAATTLFTAALAEGHGIPGAYAGAVAGVWATSLLAIAEHPLAAGLPPIHERIPAIQTALSARLEDDRGKSIAVMGQGSVLQELFECVAFVMADKPIAPPVGPIAIAARTFDALAAFAAGGERRALWQRVLEIVRHAKEADLRKAAPYLAASLADETIAEKGAIARMRGQAAKLAKEMPKPARILFGG